MVSSEEDEEGCLSLPEVYGPVTRATRIVVDAFDLSGQQFEVELEDLHARVVQHEYDHIDGIMFTDRVAPTVLPKLQPLLKFVGTTTSPSLISGASFSRSGHQ